jgi:hypothetical protein
MLLNRRIWKKSHEKFAEEYQKNRKTGKRQHYLNDPIGPENVLPSPTSQLCVAEYFKDHLNDKNYRQQSYQKSHLLFLSIKWLPFKIN